MQVRRDRRQITEGDEPTEIIKDEEPTEIIEDQVVLEPDPVGPPVVGAPVAPTLTEESVGARVVSEDERIGVAPDGTVRRQYERVEQDSARRRRALPGLGWALLALLLLVLAGLAAWWYFSRTDTKQVPAVTGVPVATAVNLLQDRGFKSAIANRSHAEPRGIVFAQNPGAGRDEKKGSTVQILVSQGPATVIVPNAVGLGEASARDKIAASGFKVSEVKIFSEQPAGVVTAQNPTAGARASKGTTIRINVSQGTGVVILPNVVGQALGDAETALAKAGLTGVVQFHVPSPQPVGTVVAQSPAGGKARKGSTVQLNVSRGPS